MNHQAHQAHQEVASDVDAIARRVVDAGLKVHKALGAGLLELLTSIASLTNSRCAASMCFGRSRCRSFTSSVSLDAGYRLDLLVENSVIVEVKSVDALTRVHEAQVLTYLKLSRRRVGLLMNFNVALFKNGVRRLVI